VNITFRTIQPDDINFIKSTWFQSFKSYNKQAAVLFDDPYNFIIHKLIEKSKIIIACPSDSTELILGYVCYDLYKNIPVVHYLYVKTIYRRMGVAHSLIRLIWDEKNMIVYTFKAEKLVNKMNAVYKPDFKQINEVKTWLDQKAQKT
jgi:hypothetical protein